MSENGIAFYIPSEKYYSRFFSMLDEIGMKDIVTVITDANDIANYPICYLPFIPHIEHFENHGLTFDDKVFYFLSKPNTRVLYDVSTEALTFEGYTSKKLLQFHQLMKDNNVDPGKVFVITANSSAQAEYEKWADKHKLHYRVQLLGYNFYLFCTYNNFMLNQWFRQNHKAVFEAAQETVSSHKKRSKHFISLNLRPRTHRHALVLHLLERGHLDNGMVSFFGEAFGSADAQTVQTQQETSAFIRSLPSGERLMTCWDTLNQMSPIMLERSADEMRKAVVGYANAEIEHLVPESKIFNELKFENYFEIVTETWFTTESCLYLTEKTVRPFIRLQPFILLGSPYTLKYLRSVGFKTFAPVIDESYDEIADPKLRLEAIFKEIDRLCAMSMDELHEAYTQLWPVLVHNFHHFLTAVPEICATEIEKNVLSELSKASSASFKPQPLSLKGLRRMLGKWKREMLSANQSSATISDDSDHSQPFRKQAAQPFVREQVKAA